ncbi:hypothetical protein SUGI_1045860 [Cryptomeria japonica]|uniref:recQ-mediated genome instability protein 1 n=1 Tax=Cryptomeria japonica TaxID=3369 RepID=UPI0024148151|nr:recQ-mediated genome instability protein 1 [Cryptomeria japonica]GLJ49410.1 hypothetical protein SUGI_1045860 [Cryptomeria japonica]
MAEVETVEISESEDELFVDAEEWQWDSAALEDHLRGLGVRPRREWLQHCLNSIANPNMTVAQQAEHCLSHFLFADFNTAGDAILPPNIHTLHATDIPGPFLLQVDEIVNLSSPLRERYKEAPAGLKRCLKLSMTDGIQRVFGIEYRPIKDLKVLLPAGVKIAIRNVHVRRGLLMLVPEVVDVLGGFVEHLEAARERLVQEVNKPPRGRRNRRDEEILSLASRALAAAWPPECSNNIPASNDAVPIAPTLAQLSSPEVTVIDTGGETHQRTPIEILPTSRSMLNHQPNEAADISMDLDRLDLVDEEIYNQLLESEENKTPFTYLACLKARKQLESVVQGRIKCILTGVKEFQFKERDKFELFVYVDDGSLISEVLIDHQVVKNIIGHSPREVTALLTSGDRQRVEAIKETMKSFQVLLRKFEGRMLVEINNESAVPIVIEMKEGCDDTWPWLLFRRCKCKHYMSQ